jgi:hypothetical protein
MALRRNQRLRREYLYAKSLEGKEKDMYERKQRIKAALAGEHCHAWLEDLARLIFVWLPRLPSNFNTHV